MLTPAPFSAKTLTPKKHAKSGFLTPENIKMHSFLTFWHQAGKFDTCTAPHLVHVTNIRYVPDLLVHIQNIFVKILKHICPWNILVSYLFHVTCIMPLQVALWGSIIFPFIFVQIQNIFIQILKIFVQILKYICQYWKQYLYHVTCIMPLQVQVALWGCINFFLFQLRLTYMHILYIHQFHSPSSSSQSSLMTGVLVIIHKEILSIYASKYRFRVLVLWS